MNKIIREVNLYGFKPDMIVGVQRGGLIPAVQLSHYYEAPLQTIMLHAIYAEASRSICQSSL